MITKVQAWR